MALFTRKKKKKAKKGSADTSADFYGGFNPKDEDGLEEFEEEKPQTFYGQTAENKDEGAEYYGDDSKEADKKASNKHDDGVQKTWLDKFDWSMLKGYKWWEYTIFGLEIVLIIYTLLILVGLISL